MHPVTEQIKVDDSEELKLRDRPHRLPWVRREGPLLPDRASREDDAEADPRGPGAVILSFPKFLGLMLSGKTFLAATQTFGFFWGQSTEESSLNSKAPHKWLGLSDPVSIAYPKLVLDHGMGLPPGHRRRNVEAQKFGKPNCARHLRALAPCGVARPIETRHRLSRKRV